MRPTTGPTAYVDDIVGTFVPAGRRPLLDAAYDQGRLVREGDPEWRDDVPVRVETIPVRRDGRVIAVVARNTNLLGVRTPSRLELAYLQTAADLTQMIAARRLPVPRCSAATTPTRRGWATASCAWTPTGRVTYASPNALSVYRRLGLTGDLDGARAGRRDPRAGAAAPPRRRGDAQRRAAAAGRRATPRSARTTRR